MSRSDLPSHSPGFVISQNVINDLTNNINNTTEYVKCLIFTEPLMPFYDNSTFMISKSMSFYQVVSPFFSCHNN